MAIKTTKLPRTQLSGLDYSTIIEDIKNLVIDNPDYNENWDNFLESNAGRMMVELFAYIADQLSTRIDWVANESFISTATQKKSVIRLLKLIGYDFSLPVAAYVNVSAKPERLTGSKIRLTTAYSQTSTFAPFSLTAKDPNGYDINFEALAYSQIDKKFLYTSDINIDLTSYTDTNEIDIGISFYEGKTHVETFIISTDNGPILTLSHSPITQDSISVFKNGQELLKVNSFLAIEAQSVATGTIANPIPYILNIKEDDKVSVEFGPTSLLKEEARRVSIDDVITVIYRVGGGTAGNITEKGINVKKTLKDLAGTSVLVSFINNTAGIRGEESETIDHALYYAPLSIKTADKTVTRDDYNTILGAYGNMLLATAYGSSNMPSNFYDKYGLFINPMEVWCFIALKKSGYTGLKPSEYNDFKWADLRLEDRFNEELSFNSGSFNSIVSIPRLTRSSTNVSLLADSAETTFKNYLYIQPPADFIENIFIVRNEDTGQDELNQTMKVMLLNNTSPLTLFNEIIHTDNRANWFIDDTGNTYFNLDKTDGDINFNIVSEEQTYAELFGNASYTNFIPISTKTFSFSMDERSKVDVVFPPGTYSVESVRDTINTEIASTYQGNGTPVINEFAFGYHKVGIKHGDGSPVLNVLEVGGEKVKCEQLVGHDFTSNPLSIKYGMANAAPFLDIRTMVIDLTADVDGSPNEPLDLQLSIPPEKYHYFEIYGSDGVTPDETAFDPESYVDISKIINRTVFKMMNEPSVICNVSNEMLDEDQTCFDMYMMPGNGGEPNSLGDLAYGVVILEGDVAADDLFWYLRGGPTGNFVIQNEKKWADYRGVASVIHADFDGINKNFLYLQSPVIGEEYSTIKTYPNTLDCFYDILGITNHGECNGIRRVSLVANNLREELGYLIYETNTFAVPYYFTETDLTFYNDVLHGSNEIVMNNKLYFSYVRDSKERLQLGNTTNYFTADTVHNLYNSVFDESMALDLNLSSFDLKFTREKEDVNSVYAVDNLVPEKRIDLVQTDFAKKVSLQLENNGVFTTVTGVPFTVDDNITFSVDFDETDPLDESNRTCVVQLNGITTFDGLFTAIYQEVVNNDTLGSIANNIVLKDPVEKTVTIKNNLKNNSGILKFYADPNPLNVGYIKMFGGGMEVLENDIIIRCSQDYFLDFEDGKVYINKMANSVKIPDSKIYAHYINDRRNEKDSQGDSIVLDEDILLDYLYPYKILSIENKLKVPKFKTFDIAGKVYYNSLKTANEIKENVEAAIRAAYNLESSDFGISIVKSQIFKIIHSIEGVEYAEISYLGYDYVEEVGVENILTSGFDQIPVICEDIFDASNINRIHGLVFIYEAV